MAVFIQVMESGNFTRAAHALGLPRSTVSTAIQTLEDRLGTQLIRRSTRRMVVTDEGTRFLARAREIVDAVDDTERMFDQGADRLTGRLRVDMPSRIGRRFVIPALPGLMEQHPELTIELSTTDRRVDLLSEGVDCIIRVGGLESSDIICRKLGDLPIVACASPGYLERYGTPRTVQDLKSHTLIDYSQTLPADVATFSYREGGETRDVPMTSRLAVNNAESYIAAARAGLGIVQIPAFDAADMLQSGELVALLPDLHAPTMQLSLLYARRRNVPSRIEGFHDWITEPAA